MGEPNAGQDWQGEGPSVGSAEGGRRWLSPAEASRLLGVHPTTLRLWTNSGKLRAYRTAGGHRRFDPADLQRVLEESQKQLPRTDNPSLARAMGHAIVLSRALETQHILSRESWYPAMESAARDEHRALGRQLLGLTVQFIARDNSHGRILEEGCRVADDMARRTHESGLSLAEAVRAFMYFRDTLIDSLVPALRRTGEMDTDDVNIYTHASEYLNQILLSFLQAYSDLSEPPMFKGRDT